MSYRVDLPILHRPFWTKFKVSCPFWDPLISGTCDAQKGLRNTQSGVLSMFLVPIIFIIHGWNQYAILLGESVAQAWRMRECISPIHPCMMKIMRTKNIDSTPLWTFLRRFWASQVPDIRGSQKRHETSNFVQNLWRKSKKIGKPSL